MKLLLLGAFDLQIDSYLKSFEDKVFWREDKIDIRTVIQENFDYIISYGYRHILSEELLLHYNDRVINMHISYLPWNRGADPNFWSFFDNTPKGVSIHYIDKGIDTGDIIYQKAINFGSHHTLASSYSILKKEIESLFYLKWPSIRIGKNKRMTQSSIGTYHSTKDKEPYLYLLNNKWNTKVSIIEMAGFNMKDDELHNNYIREYKSPFIIAEMSGNHNQSLDRALQIVEAAAEAGVDALKIQTYTADTMTMNIENPDFQIDDDESLWNGNNLYQLYQQAYTPWEWHKPIFDRAKELGMIAFSTPFDETAVDFLEELEVPMYKIASFENNDIPLIKKVAATGKPMIISTGMASIAELDETVRIAREAGCKDLILLKCTSTYPATAENTNISTIPHMRELFDVQVGLSDHTLGTGVAVASVALGATVIEKHFTLSRADGGVDSAFSMEPDEMATLVEETHRAWQAIGNVTYGPTDAEKASVKFRRSIYVAKDIQAGELFTKENTRVIRPGYGLEPKFYETVLKMKAPRNLAAGTPLSWELLT